MNVYKMQDVKFCSVDDINCKFKRKERPKCRIVIIDFLKDEDISLKFLLEYCPHLISNGLKIQDYCLLDLKKELKELKRELVFFLYRFFVPFMLS